MILRDSDVYNADHADVSDSQEISMLQAGELVAEIEMGDDRIIHVLQTSSFDCSLNALFCAATNDANYAALIKNRHNVPILEFIIKHLEYRNIEEAYRTRALMLQSMCDSDICKLEENNYNNVHISNVPWRKGLV
ncbi:uncharacterized protein LOC135164314 isoform X1 [Diachasmimorpha longicaudata]|uniref:uncharacterized protein LOC135164314 isoform X1 n=1 Tax=Diachasmimorpha longicaudata TaxID=58733 RepID=UPI0030B8CA7A